MIKEKRITFENASEIPEETLRATVNAFVESGADAGTNPETYTGWTNTPDYAILARQVLATLQSAENLTKAEPTPEITKHILRDVTFMYRVAHEEKPLENRPDLLEQLPNIFKQK